MTLLPDAGFLLFAEAASKAFPSLVRARLYVLVEQNTCEVTCDETLRGAIALADALAPERKARSSVLCVMVSGVFQNLPEGGLVCRSGRALLPA